MMKKASTKWNNNVPPVVSSSSVFMALLAVLVMIFLSPNVWMSHEGSFSSNWESVVLEHAATIFQQEQQNQQKQQQTSKGDDKHARLGPLNGVVILITGATSGIGKELAGWTFRHGATVIAMGRSSQKLRQLEQDLILNQQENGDDDDADADNHRHLAKQRFFSVMADFADLQSISDAVDDMIQRSHQQDDVGSNGIASSSGMAFPDHVDIVVCNAGIHLGFSTLWDPYQATKQGYDLTFGGTYVVE
jgi:hypothetical protein